MELLLLVAVAITSLGGYLVGRGQGLSPAGFRAALGRFLECLGAVAAFAAINLALGAAMVQAVRIFTGWFVSLYLLDDVAWIAISLLQGIAWFLWRENRGGPPTAWPGRR
jgi:hypothetical protein